MLDLSRIDLATKEEMIRLQCESREDYYRTQPVLAQEIDRWKTSSVKLADANKTLVSKKEILVAENEKPRFLKEVSPF